MLLSGMAISQGQDVQVHVLKQFGILLVCAFALAKQQRFPMWPNKDA